MSNSIDSVLNETRVFNPSDTFIKQANVSGMDSYKALVQAAQKDYAGYWANLARENQCWTYACAAIACGSMYIP